MKDLRPASAVFLFAICLLLFGCSRGSVVIELPLRSTPETYLAIDILSPFDRKVLLSAGERAYGPAANEGSEKQGAGSYVFWKEFRGRYGRIRVYDEVILALDGGVHGWLEVYPTSLYIEEVLPKQFHVKLPTETKEYKIYCQSKDRSCFITYYIKDRAIQKIFISTNV